MRSVPIALRHFHEVILPGVPVHPFFDLDMAITGLERGEGKSDRNHRFLFFPLSLA